MSVLEDIQKIIDWYTTNYAGASIENLMNAKSKILVLLARFAEEVADDKRDSVMATVFRKADYHRFKSELIDKGFAIGYSDGKAISAVVTQMTHEAESEALFFKSKLLLDLSIKIAEDMTQRISILKKEKENA